MTTLFLSLLAFAAVLVDISVAPGATLFGVRPQFTLVVIALWAALRPEVEVLLLAPVAGLLLGLLGNEPLGASVLALAPVVLLGRSIGGGSTGRPFLLILGIVAVATPAFVAVSLLVHWMAGARPTIGVEWITALVRLALVNCLLATALYWPISRLPSEESAARGQYRGF